jgi:IS30 family transposase
MKTQEECMEIRILSRQGKGIREISRMMGISRNTVRKYMRSAVNEPVNKAMGKKRGSKLDPYTRGTWSNGLLQLCRIDCQRRFCVESFRRWVTRAMSGWCDCISAA